MSWHKNRKVYLAALSGVSFGVVYLVAGLWLETQKQHLPFTLDSYSRLHNTGYGAILLLDLAPLIFGVLFGLLGVQRATNSKSFQDNPGAGKATTEHNQAEEALNIERYLMQTLMDNIPIQIYFKDLESRFIRINTTQAKLFKLNDPEQAVGKTDFDFFTPAHAQPAYDDEQEIIRTGRPISKEERETREGDADRWVLTTKMPLRDREGRIIGTFGTSADVTERRLADEKLMAERNLLRTLIDNLPDNIFVRDTESRLIMNNLAHRRHLGAASLEEMIGKTDYDFFPKVLAEAYIAEEKKIMQTGKPMINLEESSVDSEGNQKWLLTTKVPLRDSQGKIIGIVGINRDITERKQAEADLLREKKFLEALNSASPVAIVVMDNDDKIVSVNPAFENLYGYKAVEVIGKNLDDLITTEETYEEALQYNRQVMTGAIHGITKRRRKDGTLVDVEIFGVPVIVAGERSGMLALYHDISEIVHAQQEAEQASRTKSEFLANMSHEIRTPMNGVIGMLELALDTQLTPEQTDYLQTSLNSAEALLSLLNDILDFSKIEAGRLDLEAIDFSLRNAVEDVAYTLAKRAQDKGLEMACLIDPDIASSLRGDPGRLRQILINLVGNAIKFTHQGEIVIRAEPREDSDRLVTVHFSVQDTGIGIPYERQAAVFDRFTQADGTTTRMYGGTGLGLAIAKQLVQVMGGKIGLESKPGIGSTFWFDIQFEKSRTDALVMDSLPGPIPVNLAHAKILIVDDNQTNRMVLIKNVQSLGVRVDAAPSGSKALEGLRRAQRAGDPYHIVLLDMQMPGMDGEQTARAIKSDPSLRDTKIIILTSMGQRGDAIRLEALGCSGYLLKPVKQQMLFDAILAILGRRDDETAGLITRHKLSEKRKAGTRILLAEDNPVNQKLAVITLQKAEYQVDAVETGLQALEKVKTNRYSLVLMDVQMPEMDGFEATRRIREWELGKNQHIPVIAMTAYAMSGDRERCIDAGMDDYVSKPLEPRVLFNAIDRWILGPDSDKEPGSEVPESYPTTQPAEKLETNSAFLVDPSIETVPVDLESALYRFNGDREFMMEMCRDFREHLPLRLEELKTELRDGNINALSRTAHNLKGMSMNFNADQLSQLALKLETCGRQEDLTDAPALVEQIEREIKRVQEYLSQLSG